MKKIILLLVTCVSANQLWCQGTLQLTGGAYIKTTGAASLVLDNMHIVNDGSFQQAIGDGTVKLTGAINVNLSGGSPTIIN